MLTLIWLLPLVGALALATTSRWTDAVARAVATAIAAVPLLLLVVVWIDFDPKGAVFQSVTDIPWIPAVGAGYRVGVDGVALPVAAVSALLFTVCAAYPTEFRGRARAYLAWMLFLEGVSLGLFLALDLLLFYVFFDLSLVGMYFLIAIWGHEDRHRAAYKFILYTLVGSLVMLLGILSLALASDPMTFDMRTLIREQPLMGAGAPASWTLFAIGLGLVIKTPLAPLHTWLPAAHVEAPAPASTILAGVLLKMGTYGLLRLAYAPMQDTFRAHAFILGALAVFSIVYGALVALGQSHIKRRIAYTSITHMGYTVLGLVVATSAEHASRAARETALVGATLEMVAHGLITGALFLVAGSLWRRTRTFEMDEHGGVSTRAPRLTSFAVAFAFASLGLPGFAGFIAEFQIFAGALAAHPWLAGLALVGVVITAALFLQWLQRVFFGEPPPRIASMSDLGRVELVALTVLLIATVLIGVAPAFVIDVIMSSARLYAGAS